METTTTFQLALLAAWQSVTTSVLNYLPTLIGALLVFIMGLVVASLVKMGVKRFLSKIKFSQVVDHQAIKAFFDRAEVNYNLEEVVGEIFRWLVLLVFFIAGVNLLGLTTVSAFLESIITYIPRVISASLILLVGTLIAGWVESVIKGAFTNITAATGRLLAKVASYTIIVFTVLASLGELGIAERFIYILFIGFVSMLSLGCGLAFGLGGKDIVGKLLSDWYQQVKKSPKG